MATISWVSASKRTKPWTRYSKRELRHRMARQSNLACLHKDLSMGSISTQEYNHKAASRSELRQYTYLVQGQWFRDIRLNDKHTGRTGCFARVSKASGHALRRKKCLEEGSRTSRQGKVMAKFGWQQLRP